MCGFFVRKSKKLLVFENEFHHAFENYKNFENFYKIVRAAIRKLPLALVCPCFGQKNLKTFFAHSYLRHTRRQRINKLMKLTPGGQSSKLYLYVVHFFNASVN